jgi:hypothetical protein
VGFKGHDKPFPAWYPYAFDGGIAALATALYVLGWRQVVTGASPVSIEIVLFSTMSSRAR